jgi:hypothetical protein
MQPMYDGGFPWQIAVDIVGIVLGFAMIRWITRDPEDGSDHWRSHRR